MRFAYGLARQCLPRYSSKFSRHDYTRAKIGTVMLCLDPLNPRIFPGARSDAMR